MPNTNAPFGLYQISRIGDGGFSPAETMQVDAAEAGVVCIGDLVTLETDGFIEANSITPGTTRYSGVNIGPFRAASFGAISDHLVVRDKDALFVIQGDATGGLQAAVGALANVTYGAGSATTRGISQTVLAGASIAVTATLDLRIRAIFPGVGVDPLSAPFNQFAVKINKHLDNPEVAGI